MIQEHQEGGVDLGELMFHHTADAHELEFPPFGVVHLPTFEPLHLGPLVIDLSPTKHVVFMILGAVLVFASMRWLGRALQRQRAGERAPSGFANVMEAFVLWVREEMCMSKIGDEAGAKFAPLIMSIFFFIFYGNLLGLVPWGASFTGNLGVTAGMAALAFVVVEVSGMAALGAGGYMRTIFPKVQGMSGAGAVVISVAMAPIEILGKLIKPFALCFRLFGNMTAGHFVILALLGLIFTAGNLGSWAWAIAISSATLVTLIMVLELIVAFVQAYVFAVITGVLIGMMQHEH